MFCFFNLPHKGAKGQNQRQWCELARTPGQIAGWLISGKSTPPATQSPAAASSHSCLHCYPLMLLPTKGSGRHGHSLPGKNLSSAHPTRALSNITLLFQTHQGHWTPAHRATNTSAPIHAQDSGALSSSNLPGDTGSQLGSCGGWSAGSCWLGAQASEGASPAQSGLTTALLNGTSEQGN